jgi:hypothetical protein
MLVGLERFDVLRSPLRPELASTTEEEDGKE